MSRNEEITIRVTYTGTKLITYRPDRSYHGDDKPLSQIAEEDARDLAEKKVNEEELHDLHTEATVDLQVEVLDWDDFDYDNYDHFEEDEDE